MAWYVDGSFIRFQNAIKIDVARKMYDCMLLAQQQLMDDLNTPYPPASRPGQYPRRRTGRLRLGVIIWPKTVRGVLNTRPRRIALWYDPEVFYGYILIASGRKGPDDTMRKLKSRFDKILKGL